MISTQARGRLTDALQQHAGRATSTLLARQIQPIARSCAVDSYPLKDMFVVDTSAATVRMTLAKGSDLLIGLRFFFLKDSSANSLVVEALPGNTIDGLSLVDTTVDKAIIEVMWDGTSYRRLDRVAQLTSLQDQIDTLTASLLTAQSTADAAVLAASSAQSTADAAVASAATKAPLLHASQHHLGGSDRVFASSIGARMDQRRYAGSLVESVARENCTVAVALANGRMGGKPSIVLQTGTATTIAFFQVAAGSGITDIRLCVYSADLSLARITANLSASAGASLFVSGTLLDPITLLPSPLALTEGELIYPCTGGAHTGVTQSGMAQASNLAWGSPQTAVMTGLLMPPSGALVITNTGSNNNFPWVVLY